jgi:hypothetical protein
MLADAFLVLEKFAIERKHKLETAVEVQHRDSAHAMRILMENLSMSPLDFQ